ncbi:MAG: phage prohead protease, partial [Chryseobacterium sp.]
LYADAVFDTESEKGKEVARQVEQVFLRGASLGIIEMERSGDTVTKCELAEISIVDIGSNSNALKLYKEEPEIIHLSMSEARTHQTLVKILGLSASSDKTEIIKMVTDLKSENTQLNLDLNRLKTAINEEREKEAERLTGLAVKLGYIPENLRHIQKLAFKEDFEKTKNELQELIDKSIENERKSLRTDFISGFVESAKTKSLLNLTNDPKNREMNKEAWTLNEYRKHAPEELAQNPELYKKLVNEHYNNNQSKNNF